MSYKTFICIIFFTAIIGITTAENEIYHIPPSPPTIGAPISFETTIPFDIDVTGAIFLYRMYGQQSYIEIEMEEFLVGTWVGTIPSVPDSDGLEYFFLFELHDGSGMLLPKEDPSQNPYRLSVIPLANYNSNFSNTNDRRISQTEHDFLIISPNNNDIVYSDAVLFMVSLYNIPDIDISSIHLYLDSQEVTTDALVTSDIITYAPKQVEPGIKILTITASNNEGDIISPLHHTISIISPKINTSRWNNFNYTANGKSTISMDQVDEDELNIYQTELSLKGGWSKLQFKSNLKFTSEESEFKQPKNRYSAIVQSSRYLKISLGDFTPTLSPYTINGKRIRGIGTELRYKWLQFKTAHGELDRAIKGLYNTDKSYEVSNVYINNKDQVIYELDRSGYTFKNDISSYRLALNFDEKIIFGSTLLNTKSDIQSVDKVFGNASFTISDDTTIQVTQINPGTYTFSQFQNLISGEPLFDYHLSDKGWSGNKPTQNLVVGTDFRLALDEHKFLLDGYWAISFLNKDIWDGTMTLAELDTLMGDSLDGQIYGMVDTTSIPDPADFDDWMTLNMNLVPLIPIDFNLHKTDPMKAVMNMPSTAYYLKFRSLYFNNMFELLYSQVGPEFTSLGNPYFAKNTREFSVSDKLWFFNRRLQSSVIYKLKTNDILATNPNPYKEKTYGMNLNYIPGIELPSAMYGHQSIIRTNDKIEIDSLIAGDDTTFQDLRVDFITTNNLFTLNIPINRNDATYSLGGTYNSVAGTDELKNDRPDYISFSVDSTSTIIAEWDTTYINFLSQESKTQLISFVFGARYTNGLKLSVNITNFIYNHDAMGKTELIGTSISCGYPMLEDKISLSGTLSYLSSSGLSEFSNYGLSLRSTIKISNAFRMTLAIAAKVRSTSSGTEMSNSAVKLATNYIF